MKAIVYTEYGPPDVLKLQEVEKPAPETNEVLIKVAATSVTKYDTWLRSSTAPPGFWLLSRLSSGISRPNQTILGTELAGEVEAVGPDVKRFKPGDPVFGYSGMRLGAYAECVCLPEGSVAIKPANTSYEEAASVLQGALTALYFLRKANIQRGQTILIFGASGGVGNFAVQLAKYFGADVTGVCSTAKLGWVKSLGADQVIDYSQEDFTSKGQTYDIIFDTVGKTAVLRSIGSLKKSGTYLLATFGLPTLFQILWLSLTRSRKVVIGALHETPEDIEFLKELMEAGKLHSVVDRCFPIEQAAEAHRYVESGHKVGSVVLTMAHRT